MKKTTLVIMAAGIGSRFQGGVKQLAEVGPNRETIMEYSVYDAAEAGFNKVVIVIKKEIEKVFRETIGRRLDSHIEVAYVYQELADIPDCFKEKLETRVKPWGTGQAVLCCKGVIDEPFLVINADDYYGKEAYKAAYEYLNEEHHVPGIMSAGMVGFVLRNTLSDNGTVTRGICKVGQDQMLREIRETYQIEKKGEKAFAEVDGKKIELDLDSVVSMNMWALKPQFFEILEQGFYDFLEKLSLEDGKAEYLLPGIIGEMVDDRAAQVKVLRSGDKWFGVTYKEDKEAVAASIQGLVEEGVYPEKLF